MDLNRRLLGLFAAILITLTGGVAYSATDDPIELRIRVDDVLAYRGQQNISVPVWLDNYQDSVVGFNIWLQVDRPDIALFQVDTVLVHDTTYWQCLAWDGPDCTDSLAVGSNGPWDFVYVWVHEEERGNIDTTGTLIAGWEYVAASSLSGQGTDLNIVGLADMPGGDVTPGIALQQNGLPLIKTIAHALDEPGIANIIINPSFHFGFAAPNGSLIGFREQEIEYTAYWRCIQWAGDTCLNWQQVPGPPFDSTSTEIDTIWVLDTSVVEIINGSITVVEGFCGDIDGAGGVNVADLTFLVGYLFRGGSPPPDIWTADCDGSGSIDVSDLTCFVCYLFQGCPPPACSVW